MIEWKEVQLGQITIKIGSGATPRGGSNTYKSKGISLIRSQNVLDLQFTTTGLVFIDDKQADKLKNAIVEDKDVLLNITGDSVARACIVPTNILPARVNQHVAIIRANTQNTISEYILYNLISQKEELLSQSEIGATRRALTKGMIEQFELYLPPLSEQIAIASVLSSLDDKIDLLHRQNATLEKIAETIFRQWFMEETDEEWEEIPLMNVTDITIGRTPPRMESKWFSTNSNDIKWISIKDLGNNGVFISNTSECLTREAVENFNIPLIPKGSVVLSFKMTVGRVAITSEDMLSNEAIAHFKFNDNTPFSKEYLYLFLKTFKYETLGSTSSIVTAINSKIIKELVISIPDDDIMKHFKKKTIPLFKKIQSNQTQIYTLSTLRDTLLPKLMSGEIKVES